MWKPKIFQRELTPSKSIQGIFFEPMEPKILLSADAVGGLLTIDPFNEDNAKNIGLTVFESADLLNSTYGLSSGDSEIDHLNSGVNASNLDQLADVIFEHSIADDNEESIDRLTAFLSDVDNNTENRQEIIFVDVATPDYQQLIDGISAGTDTHYDIVILQSNQNGIQQISDSLMDRHDLDAIHLISHGNEIGFQLGNVWLNGSNVENYYSQLQQWSSAFDDNADLLIYGCNLASAEAGQSLISNLADITGTDVAASDDLTGATELGGDWELEYTIGDIESNDIFSPVIQQGWNNVLGSITVTTFDDVVDSVALFTLTSLDSAPGADGLVSIREAIIAANADISSGNDIIYLAAGTYNLSITGSDNSSIQGDLDITDILTIQGVSSASTIIDGTLLGVSDGLFEIRSTDVIFENLTLTNSTSNDNKTGGALTIAAGNDLTLNNVNVVSNNSIDGGGIYNAGGTLALSQVLFSGNTATEDGAAIYNDKVTGTITGSNVEFSSNVATDNGGAIFNLKGSVTLDKVLFFNNNAALGGAVYNEGGTISLTNATFSANIASVNAGAINNIEDDTLNPGTLNITHATFSGNSSPLVNGILQDASSILNLQNSILADGGSNVSGGITNSLDYNIDSDGSAGLGGANDQVADPLLDALADNGGFTRTHALLAGSVAINPVGLTGAPVQDQRSTNRDLTADIGAFEFSGNDVPVATGNTVTASEDIPLIIGVSDFNYSDAESDALVSVTISNLNLNGGTLTHSAGSVSVTNGMSISAAELADLSFTSALNDSSNSSFDYSVNDSGLGAVSATMNIVVNAVNDVPVATGNTITASEDIPLTLGVSDFNYSDAENDALVSVTISNLNLNGGTLTHSAGSVSVTNGMSISAAELADLSFTSALNDSSNSSFDYSVNDSGLGAVSATMTISVSAVNDVPTFDNAISDQSVTENSAFSFTFASNTFNDLDVTDNLTYAATLLGGGALPSWLAFNTASGTFSGTPLSADVGSISIVVTADDGNGGQVDSNTFDIVVDELNNSPTVTNLNSSASYTEGDSSVAIIDMVVSDLDSAEVITANLTLNNLATGSLSANDGASYDERTGLWSITDTVSNVNTALANLIFIPTLNNELDSSIGVVIDDGDEDISGALTGTINLMVTPVNDAPNANGLVAETTYSENDSSVALNDIIIADIDSAEIVTATLTLMDVTSGTLSSNDGASYDTLTGIWTVTGSVTDVNIALANLTFLPDSSQLLNSSVAVSIDDGDEDSSGPLLGVLSLSFNPEPVTPVTLDVEIPEIEIPLIESEVIPFDVVSEESITETITEETEEMIDESVSEEEGDVSEESVVGEFREVAIDENSVSSLFPLIDVEISNLVTSVNNNDSVEISVSNRNSVDSVVARLREEYNEFKDPLQLISSENFITKLNHMHDDLIEEKANTEKVISSSLVVSAGFSVGYVVWLARSGVLLSSVLTSLPAWRFIDPLPVLSTMAYKDNQEDDESLESMIENEDKNDEK